MRRCQTKVFHMIKWIIHSLFIRGLFILHILFHIRSSFHISSLGCCLQQNVSFTFWWLIPELVRLRFFCNWNNLLKISKSMLFLAPSMEIWALNSQGLLWGCSRWNSSWILMLLTRYNESIYRVPCETHDTQMKHILNSCRAVIWTE